MILLPLEAAAEGSVPPWVFGGLALALLVVALLVVLAIGATRPHSR